eukprot:PhM_4_TR15966/c3_g1_i2/m.45712
MPSKKPVVVEPAPSDILVPEVLHSIAKSMQRGASFRVVFRSRPLVGQDPEANTDAVFTVADDIDSEGYAWLRFADCSQDPAVKAGGQALLYAFPQLGATNEDELYDYFIVEPHVVAVPTRRCRSRPAENCESSAGGVSSASSVSSSEAVMARCFALEEEINFLDPDRWHALLKGPNEKAVLEQQLAKRFQDMKHLSVEDRRAANDKLVLLLNFVRVFVRDPDGFVLNDELTKQTRDVLLALDVHFQRNAGYSAEYCEVLRTTHAARKLPTWMQEPRSEAVVAAKVAGMSVDTRVRGP